jgi:hypothetical protein
MQYEYRILETNAPTASEQQLTNDFGSSGWLLVQIVHWQSKWYYYFARHKLDG